MKLIPLTFWAAFMPSFGLAQELTAHGNFRHMMHTGETAGAVVLGTLAVPSGWGVGATVGLRGEVVIRDGAILLSRGDDPDARLTAPQAGEKAERLGLDPAGGFPIRVKGSFSQLIWHVVTGDAPNHGGQTGHSRQTGHGGHANSQSGMNRYDKAVASGEIIGIYTGAALTGIASHPDERLHLHFVSEDGTRSGHVDEIVIPAGATLLLPSAKQAAPHDPATHDAAPILREGGKSAFAAIQDITAALMADPATDWSKVDIEALRAHLIGMDNATLRADVAAKAIEGGARFIVTSRDPAVTASIRAMVAAHAATMNGVEGSAMQVEEVAGDAAMTDTGADSARIGGLGFIGVMTVGMHHQAHHLALASGQSPHKQ